MDKMRVHTRSLVLSTLALLSFIFLAEAQQPKGATNPDVTMLVGDLQQGGHFAFRQKLRAGSSSSPHFHTADYHITVLSGKLYVGYGKKVDKASAKPLEAGTFLTIPAMQNHYEWTDEETVLQVYGRGAAKTEFKRLSKGTNEIQKHDSYDTPIEMTPGPKIVQVHGDVTKDGLYCLRLRISPGTSYPPHRHPFDQYVTVLKGTLIIGFGEDADLTRMDTVKAGGFLVIGERRVHYEQFPEETIVQIHGLEPLQTEFIKPGDK